MHDAIHNIMTSHYSTRNTDKIHTSLKHHFFPSAIIEWNKLYPNMDKKSSFKFVKPANSAKNFQKPKGIASIGLGWSY